VTTPAAGSRLPLRR